MDTVRLDLIEICKRMNINKNSNMIELGSHFGISSNIFANIVDTLYCIDTWHRSPIIYSEAERIFDTMRIQHTNKNIIKIKGFTDLTYNYFKNESVDFVYIDADHSYSSTMKDIINWLPKVKYGGYIGGHDYVKNESRTRDERRCAQGDVFEVIHDIFNDEVNTHDINWFVKKENTNIYIEKILSKSMFEV